MMKKTFILIFLTIMAACSNDSPEAVKEEIAEKKKEINQINQEIALLEEKLAKMDTTSKESFRTVVNVTTMKPRIFDHYLKINGRVEAVHEAWISPEINGQVQSINVEEGQNVPKGHLLLSLSTEITRRNIEEVKTNLELARELYEKQQKLWDQDIGTEVQYLEAKNRVESLESRLATLQEQLDMAYLRAPFSGIVENISVKEGELAAPGSRVIHMVNPDKLRILAHLSEKYIPSIKEGEEVMVSFSNEGEELDVPISRVGSVIDNDARTFEIELELNNPGNIKPNQLASLRINDFHADSAMVIPSIIMKQDVSGYYVYRTRENEENIPEATKVYVTPGKSYEDSTMIEKGLEPGMKVIVEGYNMVKDGSEVRIEE